MQQQRGAVQMLVKPISSTVRHIVRYRKVQLVAATHNAEAAVALTAVVNSMIIIIIIIIINTPTTTTTSTCL